jgi:hypothetical protein
MRTWKDIRGSKLAGMLPPSNVVVAIHTNGRWIFKQKRHHTAHATVKVVDVFSVASAML